MKAALLSLCTLALAAPTLLAQNLPPFDFTDEFYRSNGIDPTTLIGRPNGTPPGSISDNRENGPRYNNVRVLGNAAAYDHSGHPIFFYVTGLPTQASFLNNAAGTHARQIAEQYNVYEFPRASNGQFAVFPKRQDLIADLRNGYFSNNPLGVWKINIVRYTPAAFNTRDGQRELADLADRNGRDLDGTPLIRTISELENLLHDGYVSITAPPADGGPGVFRWFFCPVIENPENGAIAFDAHLDVTTGIPAAQEFVTLFESLRSPPPLAPTPGGGGRPPSCSADFNGDGDTGTDADIEAFFACLAGNCCATCGPQDFNNDGDSGTDADIESFFRVLGGATC